MTREKLWSTNVHLGFERRWAFPPAHCSECQSRLYYITSVPSDVKKTSSFGGVGRVCGLGGVRTRSEANRLQLDSRRNVRSWNLDRFRSCGIHLVAAIEFSVPGSTFPTDSRGIAVLDDRVRLGGVDVSGGALQVRLRARALAHVDIARVVAGAVCELHDRLCGPCKRGGGEVDDGEGYACVYGGGDRVWEHAVFHWVLLIGSAGVFDGGAMERAEVDLPEVHFLTNPAKGAEGHRAFESSTTVRAFHG